MLDTSHPIEMTVGDFMNFMQTLLEEGREEMRIRFKAPTELPTRYSIERSLLVVVKVEQIKTTYQSGFAKAPSIPSDRAMDAILVTLNWAENA